MSRRLREAIKTNGDTERICSLSGGVEIYVHSELTEPRDLGALEGLDGIFSESACKLVQKLDQTGFSQLSLEGNSYFTDAGELTDEGARLAINLGADAILSTIISNSEKRPLRD